MSIEAAIDVGTSSVKLLVIEAEPLGGYRILQDTSRVTGLGKGLKPGGALNPASARTTLDCIVEFARCARQLGAERIRAAGTAALRNAADGALFAAAAEEEAGIALEIISGAEEARLSRAVALRELPPGAAEVVFFDVGGGSTELTCCRGNEVLAESSLALGARSLTEQAGITQPVHKEKRQQLEELLAEQLAAGAPALQSAAGGAPGAERVRLAGLGGTASTLVWLLQGQRDQPKSDPHLATLSLAEVAGLLACIAPLDLAGVMALPNMDPARAGIIYAGAAIIHGLMRHYSVLDFIVVDRGLRFGLLLA